MNILTGVLMAAASWPLIKGKVAPNRTYGIRTKLAFSSEENWYKVNRRGGTLLFRIAFPIVIVGIVGILLPDNDMVFYGVWSFIVLLTLLVGAGIRMLLYRAD